MQAVADAAGTDINLTAELADELARGFRLQLGHKIHLYASARYVVDRAVRWNDMDGRRKVEVVRFLRGIADRLESEHKAKQAVADRVVVAGFEHQFADGVIVIQADVAEHREPALVG